MLYFRNPDEFIVEQVKELDLPEPLIPLLNRLRHPRRGWVKRNVQENGEVEFALQHVAKAVKAASCLNKSWGVDKGIVGRQLLVHELPELVLPDYTPGEISEEELRVRERRAVQSALPNDFPDRNTILGIWREFDDRITREARMAFALDKMDAYVSAEYYALSNPDYRPVAEEFFEYNLSKVADPALKKVMEKVRLECRNCTGGDLPEVAFSIYHYWLGHGIS